MLYGSNTDIRHFDAIRKHLFDEELTEHGFLLASHRDYTEIHAPDENRYQVYINTRPLLPDLYVEIWATTYYRADVDRIVITLGEGGPGYPENQFNSISLSDLVCHVDPTRRGELAEEFGLYTIPEIEELERVARIAAEDLFAFGNGFLAGDLALFYELRKTLNRNKGYWHRMSKTANHRTDEHAESMREQVALWRKYAELDTL